jgi:hypothetical protein
LDVEAGFDIAQAFTPRQLRKRVATKLIAARKMFDLMLAVIPRHALAKNVPWHMIHKLRKNMMACVHRLLRGKNNAADARKRRKNFKSITAKKSVLSSHINQLHSLHPTTLGH